MKETAKKGREKSLAILNAIGKIVPLSSIDHTLQLQETIQTASITPSEAFLRIERVRERVLGDQTFRGTIREKAVSLVLHRESVRLANFEDAIEEARIKLGLDEERESLFNDLLKRVSFEEGFKMFNMVYESISGHILRTVEELAEKFPQLTAAEIALLPLLDRVPITYLSVGNDLGFDDESEEWSSVKKSIAPTILGANPQGIFFSTSEFDFSQDEKLFEIDAFAYAGITGKREDIEHVPFRKDVRKAVDDLIPLVFTNNRLHDKVWNETKGTSLIIGFGRVDEEAYLRSFGKLPERDAKTHSFRNAINNLPPDQKKTFEEAKTSLEEKILSATIIDLGRDTLLFGYEIFSLIGILDKIPQSFLGDTPFSGYIQPYGPGVKIIDSSGKLLEYVPYRNFFLRQSITGLFWETMDVGKANKTFKDIFRQLQSQAETIVMERDQVLELEKIAVDIRLRYGIDLNILPRHSLREVRSWLEIIGVGFAKDGLVETTNSKMTLDEAKMIEAALRLVPKELLTKVKGIKKIVGVSPLLSYIEGLERRGEYVARAEEIILYSTGIIPPEVRELDTAQKIFTILHEIGESLWTTLTDEQKEKFKNISWYDTEVDQKENFLTFYSRFHDERDDFCEHFASYILHGDEFRDRAKESDPLKQKYDFIRELFEIRTGKKTEYPQISPFTIEELHGTLEQIVKKLSIEEAWELQRAREEREFQKVKKRMAEWVVSVEELAEIEEKGEEEETEE